MKRGYELLLEPSNFSLEGSAVSKDHDSEAHEARRQRRGPDSHLTHVAKELLGQFEGVQPLTDAVTVRWNTRLISSAGCANPKLWQVELNPRIREFGHSVVHRILRHELAHLLSIFRAGRKRIEAHGPEWREACADLGIPGESRCHTLPLPGRTVKYHFAYRCRACGVIIKRVRPLPRYSACYQCCLSHADGHYEERFRFDRITLEAADDIEHRHHPAQPSAGH